MKQTNNAIKFLMAQYRAIFRNANLKMFLAAATAAAAMAAGSAQADPIADWTKLDANTPELDGAKKNLTIVGAGDVSNPNAFSLTITGGDSDANQHTIKGNAKGGANFIAGAESSITVNTKTVDGAKVNLKIGDSTAPKDAARVTVGTFTNTKGNVEIIGQGAGDAASALNATTITIGDGKTADQAFVKVGTNATLNATGLGTDQGLIIKQGAKLDLAGGAVTADKILIEEGKIESSAASSITGKDITMSGGAITATKALTITATEGGSFEGKAGTITTAADGVVTYDTIKP